MDFEAPPPMFDDAPYGPGFGGPDQTVSAEGRTEAVSAPSYQIQHSEGVPPQLTAPSERPRAPEPLRTIAAPTPIVPSDVPGAPAQRPQAHPGHHPHHPTQPAHHMRGGGHRGMRGYAGAPALGDDTPQSASNLLGLALVAVPVGGYVGGRYAGALGILGGMLAAGGIVNGVRAAKGLYSPPTDPSETWVSATFAVLGLGAAAYLLYRGHGSKTAKPFQSNKSERAPALEAAPSRYRL